MDISKIYAKYFDIIDDYFRSIKHYLGSPEDSHIDLGINIANYPLISDLIFNAIVKKGFLSHILSKYNPHG
jgi:hypothetical protein